jgi:hypothetical protein
MEMNTLTKATACAMAAVLMTTGFAGAFEIKARERGEVVADMLSELGERSIGPVAVSNDKLNDAVKPHNFNVKAVNDVVLGRDKPVSTKLKLAVKAGLVHLECRTGGDDLVVANVGDIDLPAGTRLKWKVRTLAEQGDVTLRRSLGSGGKVRLADLLDGNTRKGTPCSAKVSGF